MRQRLKSRYVTLHDLHPNTVQAEVHCKLLLHTGCCLPNLSSLKIVLDSHDVGIEFAPAAAQTFPQLQELHIDNKGDLNSTDHALEWDLRSMPELKQVACDSLNQSFKWDLHQLQKLQTVFCGSTRMPKLQLPQQCEASLELQLFMRQETFDSDSPCGVEPWSCVKSLHLDRLWVGASVIGEHAGMNQRLSLLGNMLDVKHLSLAVHIGDPLAAGSGKLIFPDLATFESCDVHALVHSHGRQDASNCVALCEKSVQLPQGWATSTVTVCTPDAATTAIKGQWRGLDFRYYEPSDQTYVHLQLHRVAV